MRRAMLIVAAAGLLADCTGTSTPVSSTSVLQVVAGQNFWGSIAAQLGQTRANVQSVVTDPNADPHEYESNTNDARAFATADLVILNGAGYDDWGRKLLDASPNQRRKVLVVAEVLGRKAGDNPHFWYSPDYVIQIADHITAGYKSLDPADSSYFDQQRSAFAGTLEPYMQRLAEIKTKFAGAPVGATETVFVYMARYLGLNLISPPEFMQAVAEGNEPPANTVVLFQQQIVTRAIKVLVVNVQTATSVTNNLKIQATQQGIPVVGVSETLQPESATFQEWQDSQLIALESALNSDALTR